MAAALPLVDTPGAVPTLPVQHATDNGRRQATSASLGTGVGLYIHAIFGMP
ncbi:hypothetical protein ACFC0D_03445 [Streptomyces sp. NPDC056222]|uniref:hypothetical protein n=1 Tax=Streptomyces sp. NPDC056222 TaxID=3345749 RepID=UPI0035DE8F46